MKAKVFSVIRGLIAIVSVITGGSVLAQNTGNFRSVEEARSYLAENPTGAQAAAAFRYLVGQRIAATYPEYPRDGRVPGTARSRAPGTVLSQLELTQAMDEVSGYY